jgi:hypothetical protein
MPELLKTTEDGLKPHYHVAYIRDDGTGQMAEANGHTHEIMFQAAQEAVTDLDPASPTYGMVAQAPVEAGTIVGTGGEDFHTHELIEYEVKEKKPKGDDRTIVNDVAEGYFDARDREKDSRDEGYDADDIYMGKHWDKQKKSELEGKGRAAVTVNKTEEKLDNLWGYQKQNRTDIKYLPMEGGDEVVAELLNIVTKNILEQCFFAREESKVFEDSSLVGRGLFHDYVDYERNIQGDIIVEKWKWDEAAFAEHDKEDLSDCEMAFKERWYSFAKLKEIYPEKADQLEPENRLRPNAGDEIAEDWDKRLRSDEMVNTVTKKYKVVEAWRKVFERVSIITNVDEDFYFDAAGWSKTDVNAAETLEGFRAIPRTSYKMRVTKIASTVLLEDDFVDEDDFSLTPAYAKFRNNEFWGKVKGIKDLQILINKAYSQFVDIINKVANYGWFYDDNTFATKADREKWERNASSPGFNQRIDDVNRPPKQVEGVKFPAELVNALTVFNNDMREVMNVNLELQGLGGGGESGIAIRQKIVQQLLGNDFLFDNLSFAKALLGRKLLKRIQKVYTPERILRLVQNQNRREPVSLPARPGIAPPVAAPAGPAGPAGQPLPGAEQQPTEIPLDQYPEEELLYLLKTTDLSKHDVVVSESASSPSTMMGNFMLLTELAAKGIPIPPEAIMEVAPVPGKKKIMASIAKSQEQAAEQENKKYDTEIQKTLINAQSKTQVPGGATPLGG